MNKNYNKEFREYLAKDLEGLVYISETDAPFEVAPFEMIREVGWNKFFAPLIRENAEMSEEKIALARRYRKVKGFIEANMKRRRIYKFGQTEIHILIVGTDLSGHAMAIRTSAVETS